MAQRALSERVEALEETVAGLQGLPNQLASMKAQVDAQFEQLRQDIRDGDEETRHQMRILHEEVIARIAMLGDNGAR